MRIGRNVALIPPLRAERSEGTLPFRETPMSTSPLTVVIFGASGDLTARKLMPALYRLARKERLPPEARVVGAARTAFSHDAFRHKMAAALRGVLPENFDDAPRRSFPPRGFSVAGDGAQPG